MTIETDVGLILNSGDVGLLTETYERLLGRDPEDWRGLLCKAYAEIAEGQCKKGMHDLEQPIRAMPDDAYRLLRRDLVRKCSEAVLGTHDGDRYELDARDLEDAVFDKDEYTDELFFLEVQEQVLERLYTVEYGHIMYVSAMYSELSMSMMFNYLSPRTWHHSCHMMYLLSERLKECPCYQESSRRFQKWLEYTVEFAGGGLIMIYERLNETIEKHGTDIIDTVSDYWRRQEYLGYTDVLNSISSLQISLPSDGIGLRQGRRKLRKEVDRFMDVAVYAPLSDENVIYSCHVDNS